MWAEPRGIHVDQSELLCKDGCGYYGNPAWQGCCSKCWRERSRRAQACRQHSRFVTELRTKLSITGMVQSRHHPQLHTQVQQKNLTQGYFFCDKLHLCVSSSYLSSPNFPPVGQRCCLAELGPWVRFKESFFVEFALPAFLWVSSSCSGFLPQSKDLLLGQAARLLGKRALVPSPGVEGGSAITFSKFEEKKSTEKGRRVNTMKRLFWGPSSSPKKPNEPTESQSAALKAFQSLQPGDFTNFLKLLCKPFSQSLSANALSSALSHCFSEKDLLVQKQWDLVQDFYQSIAGHFSSLSEEQTVQMMEHIEKLIMTRLHKWVFCHDSSDDEQKDLALQRRIRSLSWVTPQMLHVPIKEERLEVNSDALLPAITGISPPALGSDNRDGRPASAAGQAGLRLQVQPECLPGAGLQKLGAGERRRLLSGMILVVLKASPPRLHSNTQYITRFGLPHSLMAGASGYYFTNLCCAVAFIEKLDGPALNLSAEEFEGYMQGKRAAPRDAETDCEGLRRARKNRQLLAEVASRQEQLAEGAQALQADLARWVQAVQTQVEEIQAKVPLNFTCTEPPSQS
ncbi:RABX5 factor, partial [Atractosteus spatula]|nr:RABX5 factor [Atractosteus spatula]